CSVHVYLSMLLRPPSRALFPYTTLFRSEKPVGRTSSPVSDARARARAIYVRGRSRRAARARRRTAERHAESPPRGAPDAARGSRSEEHTSELQSRGHLVCRLLLEKKKRQ